MSDKEASVESTTTAGAWVLVVVFWTIEPLASYGYVMVRLQVPHAAVES
jgi:hypothetical protein